MPYHHFTREEQYVISHMAIVGFSLREIGRRIGRHHTSINREIRRNRPTYVETQWGQVFHCSIFCY